MAWAKWLECPCCGEDGAEADADGYFTDGQPLVCGCRGHVSCDAETEPYIDADDCDVHLDGDIQGQTGASK